MSERLGVIVYVASTSVMHEGGEPLGVYSTAERAQAACQRDAEERAHTVKPPLTWKQYGTEWTSDAHGMYFWTVVEHIVDDAP